MGSSTRQLSRKLSTSAGGTASSAVEDFIAQSPAIATPVNTRNVPMNVLPGFILRLLFGAQILHRGIRPLQEGERTRACGLQKFSAGLVVVTFGAGSLSKPVG